MADKSFELDLLENTILMFSLWDGLSHFDCFCFSTGKNRVERLHNDVKMHTKLTIWLCYCRCFAIRLLRRRNHHCHNCLTLRLDSIQNFSEPTFTIATHVTTASHNHSPYLLSEHIALQPSLLHQIQRLLRRILLPVLHL